MPARMVAQPDGGSMRIACAVAGRRLLLAFRLHVSGAQAVGQGEQNARHHEYQMDAPDSGSLLACAPSWSLTPVKWSPAAMMSASRSGGRRDGALLDRASA